MFRSLLAPDFTGYAFGLLCLAVTWQDQGERIPRCPHDGLAQDRRRAASDVGDHRRSREHPAAEVGQRGGQCARSGFAAVAASCALSWVASKRPAAHYIRNATW